MTNTLAKSGALYELHRVRSALEIAIRFYACRSRQLRRAIRRQWWTVLFLKLREFCPWSILNCTHLEFQRRGCANICSRCGKHWFPVRKSSSSAQSGVLPSSIGNRQSAFRNG